jgi:hypothetical protein
MWSFARYDEVAAVLDSLDAAACGRLYRLLGPLAEAAFRDLGHPEGGLDLRLAAALHELLRAPLPDADRMELVPGEVGITWAYADPELEALDPAQKHLLRMGPANARRVKAKLRELARAAGLEGFEPPPR